MYYHEGPVADLNQMMFFDHKGSLLFLLLNRQPKIIRISDYQERLQNKLDQEKLGHENLDHKKEDNYTVNATPDQIQASLLEAAEIMRKSPFYAILIGYESVVTGKITLLNRIRVFAKQSDYEKKAYRNGYKCIAFVMKEGARVPVSSVKYKKAPSGSKISPWISDHASVHIYVR